MTGESVRKGVTLVDKYNEGDQTSEPHSRSNRCDFLSPSSNHGWIMRPTSRTAALETPPWKWADKVLHSVEEKKRAVSAAPVRDHTTCRRSVGGVRLTKAPMRVL